MIITSMELLAKAVKIATPNFGYPYRSIFDWIEEFDQHGPTIPLYLFLLTDYPVISHGPVLGGFIYNSFRYIWSIGDEECIETYCKMLMIDLSVNYNSKLDIDSEEFDNQYLLWPSYRAYQMFNEAYGDIPTNLASAESMRCLFYDEYKVGFNDSVFTPQHSHFRKFGNGHATVFTHDIKDIFKVSAEFRLTPSSAAKVDPTRADDAKKFLFQVFNQLDNACESCHKIVCECCLSPGYTDDEDDSKSNKRKSDDEDDDIIYLGTSKKIIRVDDDYNDDVVMLEQIANELKLSLNYNDNTLIDKLIKN